MTSFRQSDAHRANKMMPVVQRIARRLVRRLPDHVDRADIVGAGMLGLADAIDKRRRDADEDFEAYAVRRIRGEMLEELRRLDPLTRTQRSLLRSVERAERDAQLAMGTIPPPAELARGAGVSERDLDDARRLRSHGRTRPADDLRSLIPGPLQSPEDELDLAQQRHRVEQAVTQLPKRMQRALACYQSGVTLREVGVELGVSEARVCQIRKEAVGRLRDSVASLRPDSPKGGRLRPNAA